MISTICRTGQTDNRLGLWVTFDNPKHGPTKGQKPIHDLKEHIGQKAEKRRPKTTNSQIPLSKVPGATALREVFPLETVHRTVSCRAPGQMVEPDGIEPTT